MGKQKRKDQKIDDKSIEPELWLKAQYSFHTFAYRDPRSAFATAIGLPVVSPTTVQLGIASSLFQIGKEKEARYFLSNVHECKVLIEAPNGAIFFRTFHQLRRYETSKYDDPKKGKINPRIGLTKINQGTREYGLIDGEITVYVGIIKQLFEDVKIALTNMTHLGTHDSLCSLVREIEIIPKPQNILFLPSKKYTEEIRKEGVKKTFNRSITIVTLSKFKKDVKPVSPHWWMAGGRDTELIPYVIPGRFEGTSRGKIYRKY